MPLQSLIASPSTRLINNQLNRSYTSGALRTYFVLDYLKAISTTMLGTLVSLTLAFQKFDFFSAILVAISPIYACVMGSILGIVSVNPQNLSMLSWVATLLITGIETTLKALYSAIAGNMTVPTISGIEKVAEVSIAMSILILSVRYAITTIHTTVRNCDTIAADVNGDSFWQAATKDIQEVLDTIKDKVCCLLNHGGGNLSTQVMVPHANQGGQNTTHFSM